MGIQGLLRGMSDFSEKGNVAHFSNQTLAVDASSWLHKSVYSISKDYVEATERSRTIIDPKSLRVSSSYVERRCQELLTHARIRKICLVMDGKRCPLKAVTNEDRERRRQANLEEARQLMREGCPHKAEEKYRMCIKIHERFASAVAQDIQRKMNKSGRVQIIQSPHEADAQLVKLCVDGIADAIVTEDSDVLVYAAVCRLYAPILFKLERNGGECDVISMKWLFDDSAVPKRKDPKKTNVMFSVLCSLINREARRPGSGVRLFVQACVLTGSDYSPSRLSGVGLVTAFKLLKEQSHRTSCERFSRTLSLLPRKKRGKENMKEYEENLSQSEAVFFHHPVLQLRDNSIVPLTPFRAPDANNKDDFHPKLNRFGGDLSFLGDFTQSTERALSSPEQSSLGSFSVKQIVCKPKKRKQSTAVSNGSYKSKAPVQNPYKKKRGEEDYQGRQLDDIAILMNPYKKKEPIRQPFSTVDANKAKKAESNIFADFAHGAAASAQDTRFVRPRFDSTGQRLSGSMSDKLKQLKSETAIMAARLDQAEVNGSQAQVHIGSSNRQHQGGGHMTPVQRHSSKLGHSPRRSKSNLNLLHHSFASFGSSQHRRSYAVSDPMAEQDGLHARTSQPVERDAEADGFTAEIEDQSSTAQSGGLGSPIANTKEKMAVSPLNGRNKYRNSNHRISGGLASCRYSDKSAQGEQDFTDDFIDDNEVILSGRGIRGTKSPYAKGTDRDGVDNWDSDEHRVASAVADGSSNELAIDVDNFAATSKYFRNFKPGGGRRVTLDSPPREPVRSAPKASSPGSDSVLSEIEEPQASDQPLFRPADRTSLCRHAPLEIETTPHPERHRRKIPQSKILDHFERITSDVPKAPKKALRRQHSRREGQIRHQFTFKPNLDASHDDDEWFD